MATRMEAINNMAPRIDAGPAVNILDILRDVLSSRGLNPDNAEEVYQTFLGNMLEQLSRGEEADVFGIGTMKLVRSEDGEMDVVFETNHELEEQMSRSEQVQEKIVNRENIGLSDDQLVAKWNKLYPNDPVIE